MGCRSRFPDALIRDAGWRAELAAHAAHAALDGPDGVRRLVTGWQVKTS